MAGEMTFTDLKGKAIASITGATVGSEEVVIVTKCGLSFKLMHWQSCCEWVRIAEVHGEPADLFGAVVGVAEESSNSDPNGTDDYESWTWTFYRLSTDKGPLVLRWLGTSNGYYSESVDCEVTRA